MPACLADQSCLTLRDPVACNLPGSSIYGTSQSRILEWIAMYFSRGSFPPRGQAHISCVFCTAGRFFTHWATWETPYICIGTANFWKGTYEAKIVISREWDCWGFYWWKRLFHFGPFSTFYVFFRKQIYISFIVKTIPGLICHKPKPIQGHILYISISQLWLNIRIIWRRFKRSRCQGTCSQRFLFHGSGKGCGHR